jgi:L-threonylcarbamoyladenylate synthase
VVVSLPSVTSADASLLEECLAGDGIAVIPTDTVYGLACSPASEIAVRRIYQLKRRPPRKPAAVMFFALDPALQALIDLGPRTHAALIALLPGPLTLLLPDSSRRYPLAEGASADIGVGDGDAPLLGLRVPAFSGPSAALSTVRLPALQSSANFSGDPDPHRLSDVPIELRSGANLVLDGGDLPGVASTVLDLGDYERTGGWRIVRAGLVGERELAQTLR